MVAGITYARAMVETSRCIHHTAAGGSVLTEPDRAFAEKVAVAFEEAGLAATVVDDPEPVIWDK